ncbi:MAG: TonB-dependent receptor, partial [Tepidimonas sp.]|uniref:TonB-dependent receptor n=1 Tax=Tepidimonas sp. TaxID=2002775 RepID=UPI004054CCDB
LDTDEVGSTAYLTRNHVLSAAWQTDGHVWEAKLYRQDTPYQLYPNQRMDMLDNESTKLNLAYSGRYAWGRLKARVWAEEVDHFMDFGADKRYWYGMQSGGPRSVDGRPCSPLGPMCAAGMPMYTDSRTRGASVLGEWDLTAKDVVRVGAEVHRYRLDDYWTPSGAMMWPGTFWNIRDGHRDRDALLAEWERRLDGWHWVGGVRAERVKTRADEVRGYSDAPTAEGFQARDAAAFNARDRRRTFDNWDAMLGVRYQLSPAVALETALSHRERAPGLYELYPWSTWQMAALMNNFVGDGNGYIGNPDLRDERANTLSMALDWQDPNRQWGVRVAPYVTRINGYIDAVQWDSRNNAPVATPQRDRFVLLRYANQSARLYGVDITAHTALARNAWGDWQLRGALSAVDARNRTTKSGLYGVIPLQARAAVAQRWGKWDNEIEWVGVKAKTRISQVRNETRTPGYALVNLRASYRWNDWRFDFGIDNLLDRQYYLPAGGAYVGQGTTMTNPQLPNYPQWGTPVPGPGRMVYAGVTRRF